jgi:adenine C2-methylase RlmN of 23S rRNA A2503 and tRNA A37
MIDPQRFGLAGMHVTVSTVGVIPAIRKVSADDFETTLKPPVL